MEITTGEWICPIALCSNVNYAKKAYCSKCGTARFKDINGDLQHTRQQRYNDWMCEHCGNANWSRRMNCNICKRPKVQSP